jgi:CRISPR/Cas system-associated exonuclease Cas4 (RecB family)
MNRIGSVKYKKIKRISPSHFGLMKRCAFTVVLSEAFHKKPILPMPPNAYLGIVIHRVLEQIAKRKIKDVVELDSLFTEELNVIETRLAEEGNNSYVPLQLSARDFGMKKLLLRRHLVRHQGPIAASVRSETVFKSEEWFESKDGVLAGRPDLVIESEEGTEIIDFKTGSVLDEVGNLGGDISSEVKDEYKDQLRLYAYLYYESRGKFPERLSIVDIRKSNYRVNASLEECMILFSEVKEMFQKVNQCISDDAFDKIAFPSKDNCNYCLYRPACPYYLEFLKSDRTMNDLIGVVGESRKFLNGNITFKLVFEGKEIEISGLQNFQCDQLAECKSKRVHVFNLRRVGDTNSYTATKTTRIYEAS